MNEFKDMQEKENELFNRKEINFNIEAEKTPSYKEIQKLIAEKFSKEQGLIKINNIYGKFGSKNFKINAFIYNSKEDYEKSEGKIKEEQEAKEDTEEINKKTDEQKNKEEKQEQSNEKEPEKPETENEKEQEKVEKKETTDKESDEIKNTKPQKNSE